VGPQADPELKAAEPVHGRPASKGQAVRHPDDWGFDAILYRSDKVHPKARSWGLLFDERYKGRIAWFDDPVESLTIAGLYLGFKNPWNADRRPAQAVSEAAHLQKAPRPHESGRPETEMDNAFASGDIWIALAWPNDWVQMRRRS